MVATDEDDKLLFASFKDGIPADFVIKTYKGETSENTFWVTSDFFEGCSKLEVFRNIKDGQLMVLLPGKFFEKRLKSFSILILSHLSLVPDLF